MRVYGGWQDISDVPETLVKRLEHYFLTYKKTCPVRLPLDALGRILTVEEALGVINRSRKDYVNKFGKLENRLSIAAIEAITLDKMRRKMDKTTEE